MPEEVALTEEEMLEGRITVVDPVSGDYELDDVYASAPYFAEEKLGIIEDLIESGELMTPAVKPGDTVYFLYKNTVVLEGELARAFTEYNASAEKYFFYVSLHSDFYGLSIVYPSSEYGQTWFKTQAAAEAALQEILEAEEEENVGDDPE